MCILICELSCFLCAVGCLDGFYECENGECIFRSDRCNGEKDCTDGSDEGADNCGKFGINHIHARYCVQGS